MRTWLIAVVTVFIAGTFAVIGRAQPRGQWVYERCWTVECIARVLNRLDAERAAEAKLTTWRDSTDVWYRK